MLKIGFFSSQNYASRFAFSGVLRAMHAALQRRFPGIVDLGNPSAEGLVGTIQNRLSWTVPPVDASAPDFEQRARSFCQRVERQLDRHRCDVLFAPVASPELFRWVKSIPIVYCSDATFELYRQTYNCPFTVEESALRERLERRAIAAARRLVYPSHWAASSAVASYGAPRERVDIAEFGANIECPPPMDALLRRCRTRTECRLVFVGGDFERKGVDIAIETLRRLQAHGVDARLTIVGAKVPARYRDPRIETFPFLSRENWRERELLERIYLQGHFFVFPTRADCSPIVLSEAAAYGLPVVCSSVGGIPDIVIDMVNGRLLCPGASPDRYAQLIAEIWESDACYRGFVERARLEYERRLNWDVWAARVERSLRDAGAPEKGPRVRGAFTREHAGPASLRQDASQGKMFD
jgi:glycosyltransferase involved in cell wall biosynthesis